MTGQDLRGQNLRGHVALVTGGSRGIGAAVAVALAEAGAAVAVNYRERADDANAVVATITAKGGRAMAVAADVSQAAAVTAMVEQVAAGLGPVDILVNNAGIAIVRGVDELTEDDFDRTILVNLKSAFLCTQAVLAHMRTQHWGRIVNISSGAGRSVSLTGIQAYASAKAGQIGFTRQMAHELGRFAITVNCIAPGFVLSNPTTVKQWESYGEQGQAALVEGIALRRLGAPEDIANGVRFFVSESSGWITGQTLSIDGGHALF